MSVTFRSITPSRAGLNDSSSPPSTPHSQIPRVPSCGQFSRSSTPRPLSPVSTVSSHLEDLSGLPEKVNEILMKAACIMRAAIFPLPSLQYTRVHKTRMYVDPTMPFVCERDGTLYYFFPKEPGLKESDLPAPPKKEPVLDRANRVQGTAVKLPIDRVSLFVIITIRQPAKLPTTYLMYQDQRKFVMQEIDYRAGVNYVHPPQVYAI